VINPVYCYEGGKMDFKKAFNKENPVDVERAAIIVNRGWIPAEYRDKRSRPEEINSRELVKLTGTWRKGKNVHEYKVPNNPESNEWNNLCLEDIGIFWDLPNFDEAKYYYFQLVDLQGNNDDLKKNSPAQIETSDDIITDHYGWKWHESRNKSIFRFFGGVSAVSLGIAALAI